MKRSGENQPVRNGFIPFRGSTDKNIMRFCMMALLNF